MKDYQKACEEVEEVKRPERGPVEPIGGVCSAEKLNEILENPENAELKISYKVPELEAAKFVSDKTTAMDQPPDQFTPKTGGLGLKRKKTGQETKDGIKQKKAKTLADKRDQLRDDIMKYGVAAIEKLYPRQAFYQVKKPSPKGIRGSPIKMKPKPSGLDFDEIDVRKILRPLSHSKYIKEPDYDHMVFINRREGLVPLSSLCKEEVKSVMSSNVKLLKGRNVRLGKPRVFVKDNGRLVAVGGSRHPEGLGIRVVRAPKLVKILPMEKMLPFEMDVEYANFAVSAIPDLSKLSKKVDIRDIKRMNRMKALESRKLKDTLKDGKETIVDHLFNKINPPLPEEEEEKASLPHIEEKSETKTEMKINDNTEMEIVTQEEFAVGPGQKLHNDWNDAKTKGKMPIDITDDKPIITEDFKKAMEAKKGTSILSGVDNCDVPECYCHDEGTESQQFSRSQTPQLSESGSATPKEPSKAGKNKTAKNLKKVKRALKTLGVNFLHFEDEQEGHGGDENSQQNGQNCDKEYCKFGCICDSITGKTSLPPVHCGKVECMFHCSCSKDALRLTTHNDQHKIGIAAEGLRSSSFRKLAQEELKFSNTIVASGHDLLMIGGTSGRQKRERKVPSRYQDTDAFFDSNTGLPATNAQKAAAVLMLDDHQLSASMPNNPGSINVRRLTQESLKHEKIKKCTVILPRLGLETSKLKPWCMFHNVHDCPCAKFKNPLDYAPDVNRSRNVAKRTLGNNFKTTKKSDDEPIIEIIIEQDEDEEPAPEMSGKYYHNPNDHCARTHGHVIKNTLKKPTKYPQRVVIVKPFKIEKEVKKEVKKEIEKEVVKEITPPPQMPEEPTTDFGKITHVTTLSNFKPIAPKPSPTVQTVSAPPPKATKAKVLPPISGPNVINPKPVTFQVDDFKDFKLHPKAKGSFMFANWKIVRHLIKMKKIKVWAHSKPRQLSLLVSWADQMSYVMDAVDIHKVAFVDKSHPMFDIMKTLPLEIPEATHIAMTHNGICWEIAGLAFNHPKESKEEDPTKPTKAEIKKKGGISKVMYPKQNGDICEAAPKNKVKGNNETMVDHLAEVQKLPNGVNLITMKRPGIAQPIQVKLPITESNQNWCTIRVDIQDVAVRCPDSDLNLKVHVLKKAADLAATEKTTVRIPINTQGEVQNFGVYAVPGLESHVFVGPFTSKDENVDPDEIVCLDEKPSPSAASEAAAEDVLVPLQPPQPNFNIDHKKIRQEAILGQIPQKVSHEDDSSTNEDLEIITTRDEEDEEEERNLHPTRMSPQYVNPSRNPFGRVVICADPTQRAEFYNSSNDERVQAVDINESSIKVFMGKDLVSFLHPKFRDHEVICDNVANVKKWMEFFLDEEKAKPKALSLKPMADLLQPQRPERPKVVEPFEDLENTPKERIVNGRKFVCHRVVHNGKQGVALVFDRRHHADMRKLYHGLNQILASNGLRKVTDCVQILNRARDEIMRLEKLDEDFSARKKELMLKRQQLFKDFASKLNWLPNTADKKAALLELKEGIKKIKDHKLMSGNHHNRWDETVMIPTDQSSKLFPTESEMNMTKADLQNLAPISSMSSSFTPMNRTPYSDITGLQTVRKDGKVSRPMNAFMLWAKEQRKELIAKGMDGASVSKLLAEKWKSMVPDEQREYYIEAERLKNLHQIQHPNYKYNPKARRLGMKKSMAKLDPLPSSSQTMEVANQAQQQQEFIIQTTSYDQEEIGLIEEKPMVVAEQQQPIMMVEDNLGEHFMSFASSVAASSVPPECIELD